MRRVALALIVLLLALVAWWLLLDPPARVVTRPSAPPFSPPVGVDPPVSEVAPVTSPARRWVVERPNGITIEFESEADREAFLRKHPEERHLSGTVVDASGTGIAGARVHVFAIPGRDSPLVPTARVDTGSDGRFSLPAQSGELAIAVVAPGFRSGGKPTVAVEDRSLTLAPIVLERHPRLRIAVHRGEG